MADEESTPRKAKAGGAAVAVGTGKNFVNVRPRDDDDMEEEEEEEVTQNRPAKRTFTPRLKQKPHPPYPPMHLVTLSQANLLTASAAATAGALTKIDSSDDESIGVDDMGIDPPDDDEEDDEEDEEDEKDDDFVDDNRDLPGDF